MSLVFFGLTGGIACGKSVVASFFCARGLPVIDADLLARQAVAPGSDAIVDIANALGDAVLDDAGHLDRRRLADSIFGDSAARARLEAVLHPHILALARREAATHAAAGHPLAVFDAALIVECGLADAHRPLVVVAVDERIQLARLMDRNALTEEQARARIAAQAPLKDKIAAADHVIDTGVSFDAVRQRADEVLRAICVQCGVHPSRYGLA